ncbi:MAG: flagellar hook-basal body complex protein, partial [Oscillospiraceae bacterium]|nr:flagellar hook-basal body complex protein [Oscillospiraceae bacterium]
MMRSLYSGVSGLKNHQTRMDVIGNNIANVNTAAFKASRTVFVDIYSQTVRTSSAGSPNGVAEIGEVLGGTNPSQIGLGVKLGSVDILFTSGATQRTDNATDLAISGDGFFVVDINGTAGASAQDTTLMNSANEALFLAQEGAKKFYDIAMKNASTTDDRTKANQAYQLLLGLTNYGFNTTTSGAEPLVQVIDPAALTALDADSTIGTIEALFTTQFSTPMPVGFENLGTFVEQAKTWLEPTATTTSVAVAKVNALANKLAEAAWDDFQTQLYFAQNEAKQPYTSGTPDTGNAYYDPDTTGTPPNPDNIATSDSTNGELSAVSPLNRAILRLVDNLFGDAVKAMTTLAPNTVPPTTEDGSIAIADAELEDFKDPVQADAKRVAAEAIAKLLGMNGYETIQTKIQNIYSPQGNGGMMFSRAGNFYMDSNGFLVTSEGNMLMGYEAVPTVDHLGNKIIGQETGTGTIEYPGALKVDPSQPVFDVPTDEEQQDRTGDTAAQKLRQINVSGYVS